MSSNAPDGPEKRTAAGAAAERYLPAASAIFHRTGSVTTDGRDRVALAPPRRRAPHSRDPRRDSLRRRPSSWTPRRGGLDRVRRRRIPSFPRTRVGDGRIATVYQRGMRPSIHPVRLEDQSDAVLRGRAMPTRWPSDSQAPRHLSVAPTGGHRTRDGLPRIGRFPPALDPSHRTGATEE